MWSTAASGMLDDKQWIMLGGDIFDFRWAEHTSHHQTLDAIRSWLEQLFTRYPDARVAYVLGNHDSHPEMFPLLNDLSRAYSRFVWDPVWVRLGDCLFCHGDMLDAGGGGAKLATYRQQFHHERPASRMAHRAYDAAVAIRLHRAIPTLRHRPLATCQRLAAYLWLENIPQMSEITRVFFGHTHMPVDGYRIEKLTFFNPGASLKHLPFHPINFEVDYSDAISTSCCS